MGGSNIWTVLTRKKTYNSDSVEKTDLSRCMSLLDLTLLGIGATLGLGVYVLAGSVAKNMAGPATTISFLVAGVASAIAALCYAEFASRVPRAGSAYIYSYVCVGEAAAFVIGWSLVMEYVIGSASVARGLVSYIDAQTGQTMARWMTETLPMNVDYLSPYPDFASCLLLLVLSGLLSSGVKESTIVNNLFTIINVATILTVIGAGSFKADPYNWNIPKAAIPAGVNGGEGGFIPFGVGGIMKGAAECFYGFVGFDAVATTGEEAKNPQRNIPLAIVISLTIIFFAYFSISTVLTMMWPYYDQNPLAPLPHVFTMVGWPVITWIVTIGAVFALMTSMIGSLFPLPRILYAMANDGLLYKFLANVNPRTRTPVTATLVSGLCSGVIAMIFDLQHLVEMLSIGTLLAYSIVAVCVLILRYEDPEPEMEETAMKSRGLQTVEQSSLHTLSFLFNLNMKKYPSQASSILSKSAVGIYCLLAIVFCTILTLGNDAVLHQHLWVVCLLSALGIAMVITLVVLSRQPNTTLGLKFKVPLVPILPAASILMNIYLMLQLESATWVRLGGWMLIGFFIYFTYGIRNSVEGKKRQMLHDSDIGETSPPISTTSSALYNHHHPDYRTSPSSEDTKL